VRKLRRIKYIIICTLLLSVIFTDKSSAATAFCAEYKNLIKTMEKKYKEQPVARGLTSDGKMMEILSSKNGETFTIIFVKSDGQACAVGAGENWRSLEWILNELDS
jgi:hypothetical protein